MLKEEWEQYWLGVLDVLEVINTDVVEGTFYAGMSAVLEAIQESGTASIPDMVAEIEKWCEEYQSRNGRSCSRVP